MKSRVAEWWRTYRSAIFIAVAVVGALATAAAFIWPITDLIASHDVGRTVGPQRATQLQTAREAVRTQLLTLAAGLFVAGALWFTAQNYRLSRQGQVTDRYTKAIEQLGSDKLDVRIGAIYALERIARDSVEDHPTVMEVLAAFIREHSREQWPPSAMDDRGPNTPERAIRPDVLAAINVIGRRNPKHDRERIDLTGADLPGVFLRGASLAYADFTGADLMSADLIAADLTHADFTGADLTRANLATANLTGAVLIQADLTSAYLYNTNLFAAGFTGANLDDTNLTDANLAVANLTDVDLTVANLTGADFGPGGPQLGGALLGGVRWPQELPVPEGWIREPASGLLRRAETDADDSGN
jgi:Pentapeptide repeats (8 copies)